MNVVSVHNKYSSGNKKLILRYCTNADDIYKLNIMKEEKLKETFSWKSCCTFLLWPGTVKLFL